MALIATFKTKANNNPIGWAVMPVEDTQEVDSTEAAIQAAADRAEATGKIVHVDAGATGHTIQPSLRACTGAKTKAELHRVRGCLTTAEELPDD